MQKNILTYEELTSKALRYLKSCNELAYYDLVSRYKGDDDFDDDDADYGQEIVNAYMKGFYDAYDCIVKLAEQLKETDNRNLLEAFGKASGKKEDAGKEGEKPASPYDNRQVEV